jgi:uncharacterized protein
MGRATDALAVRERDPRWDIESKQKEVAMQQTAVSQQEQVATIRSFYEAFARGDVPHILARLADDVEWRSPPSVPWSRGTHRGPDEVGQYFGRMMEHWSEFSVEPAEVLAGDDHVLSIGTYRGRARETGREFETSYAHLWRLSDDGKVVDHEAYTDTATIMEALAT